MTWPHDIWALIMEASWKSTLLLIVALAPIRLLGNRSAALRHLIWASVLAGLLFLPAVRFAAPSLSITPVIIVPSSWNSGIERVAARPLDAKVTLALAWAAGMLFVLLRLALAILRSRRIAASAVPLDTTWPSLPLRQCVEILQSNGISVPIATGIFHRRIILPSSANQWPIERFRVAVAHEMAHVVRRDCLVNILVEIVCSVYWFHPLVWLAARKCREEAEKACDDQVLAGGADPAEYAGHLLSAARAAKPARIPAVAAAMVTSPSTLEKRLTAILDCSHNRASLHRATRIAAVALAAFCVVLLPSLRPVLAQNQDKPRSRSLLMIGQDQRTYRVNEDGVTPPRVLYKVEPEYTQQARDAGIEGSVVLSVEIDPDGLPQNIQVTRSLDPGLDQNGIHAVEQWKFSPGKKDGKPVRVAAKIEINFRLE